MEEKFDIWGWPWLLESFPEVPLLSIIPDRSDHENLNNKSGQIRDMVVRCISQMVQSRASNIKSGKVEIFLEQREVVFLSPCKICENLNLSSVHL